MRPCRDGQKSWLGSCRSHIPSFRSPAASSSPTVKPRKTTKCLRKKPRSALIASLHFDSTDITITRRNASPKSLKLAAYVLRGAPLFEFANALGVLSFSQTVLHYGWIPFIIYVGFTRSNPQPSLIKCVTQFSSVACATPLTSFRQVD